MEYPTTKILQGSFNSEDYLYETCLKGKKNMCKCKNDQDCKESNPETSK
jgi:hypothetical protein